MAGNWKMYKTPAETIAFFVKFRPLAGQAEHCEVVICPPFTNLAAAVEAAQGTRIQIGAQNIGWAREGAFTGEISASMLLAVGDELPAALQVSAGHGRQRTVLGVSDRQPVLAGNLRGTQDSPSTNRLTHISPSQVTLPH